MQWPEFLAFLHDINEEIPEGYVLVPIPSSAFPHYTTWMMKRSHIEELRRRGEMA